MHVSAGYALSSNSYTHLELDCVSGVATPEGEKCHLFGQREGNTHDREGENKAMYSSNKQTNSDNFEFHLEPDCVPGETTLDGKKTGR